MSMIAALSKIRPHTTSTLLHQKAPAKLLVALETTLTEQNTERSPTAYFAALLTTLDSSKNNPTFGEGDVLPAILYLLALVMPYVPPLVIRTNLTVLLSLLNPIFPALLPYAPPLRSQLTIFSSIIKALDIPLLDNPNLRQAFNLILDLTIDPRPKVRKRAADVIREVLSNVPPPLPVHPYAERVGEWMVSTLHVVNSGAGSFGKLTKDAEMTTGPEAGIHMVAMAKPIVAYLPRSVLPSLTSAMLPLPRLGNPYLSQSSYSLLATIVSDDSTSSDVTPLIRALLSSPPVKTDTTQTPAWLELLQAAFSTGLVSLDEKEAETVFKSIFEYLESSDTNIQKCSAQALSIFLSKVITNDMITAASLEKDQKKLTSAVGQIITHVRTSLHSLQFTRAIPQILTILAALVKTLRYRPVNKSITIPPTAAEIMVLDLIQYSGQLRIKKGFEHKEAVDQVLRTAIGVVGPEVILNASFFFIYLRTFDMLRERRSKGQEPNAYLLPLLSVPHPSPLSHFVNYFVPLSESMFNLQQTAEGAGRNSEAKMWEVLISQIWNGFVGYCHAPKDLPEVFDAKFAQLLSQILYSQPSLRPPILKALKVLVESHSWIESDIVTVEDGHRNLDHLRSQAESWFAVLFNVFGSVGQDGKGMVGDVISAWIKIAGDEAVVKMYHKVVSLFQQEIKNPSKPTSVKGTDAPNMLLMTQDLLILILPTLPRAECKELWDLCLSGVVIGHSESGVQKRGYRILTKLIEAGRLTSVLDVEDVITKLTSSSDTVTAPAKRDRITLIALLLPSVSSHSLHLVPVLIPEAVLATKEPAERTRGAAFELIVAMGHKMKEGGIVKRNRLDGMESDDAHEVQATVEEYVTMIAAGLVGATPHMISATITAISRLVFEFKDDIPTNMLDEILSTIFVFVTSANREIVKSALGFIKLSVHTLPVELVANHLKQLVPALLNWSGDHKNHFKVKVRHIFERMIRRFGWDTVYGCVGDSPEDKEKGKVLQNIKKRKDRAKRKKAKAEAEGEDDDEDEEPNKKTGDAFEDVLYGSESEIEDTDDETGPSRPSTKTQSFKGREKNREKGVRIRLDDDEPMDLLQGAADKVIAGGRDRRRKPGQEASHFKQDEATGRMIIEEEGKEGEDDNDDEDMAGGAYKESLTSVDGFTRGANGRVKFHKDTKKRRANDVDGDGDVDMEDANGPKKANKKRKKEIKLGQEFKAKHAGGDVKKGGVDPYAYLPLSQATKKKNGKQQRINVVGRR
ncbi:hypothetical protein Clacol_000403 [Clathrus columnatus]|uniref:Ribosomal RNA-processing protein 12-like conserved domain-containing protein n=1 Tax=Clathrus columnatus TaxID=1419009 RepID=A0AAV4ZYG8_9AGAM|nr:hypothetical protein Clacol_000403 [Clathrus columnatus]